MKSIISILVVLLLSAYSMAPNQSRLISGTVKDEAGNLLSGVTVVVKGTSNGTVTDINGAYQISVNAGAKYLVFTYIGLEQKEVRITKSNRINVVLKNANMVLEDIVFTEAEAVKSYEIKTADMAAQRPGGPLYTRTGGIKKSHVNASYAPEPGYVQHNTEGYCADNLL